MNKTAIYHRPMSEYAYGVDEEHVTFRIRTAKDDIESIDFYFGDRSCRQTPVIFTKVPMKKVAFDRLFDYYEVTLENPYKRINYYFELRAKGERVLYYGDCFMEDNVDDRSEYFQLPYNHRADIITPPDWAKDAIIYNIFPDSFATSHRYISRKETSIQLENGQMVKGKLGGTIRGIMDNVDYLEDLGVNAIYVNPIFTAGEYHKYDLIDYFTIDPCFGTNEEFKKMVDCLHAHGIRVIIDGVFNHCGWKFFAFQDVVDKGEESKYKDWFYRLEFPVVVPDTWEEYPTYECFGYERMMPKMNTQNPEVIEYFCKVCRYWLEEFQLDGWRLDVASEINDAFWMEFYKTAKSVNKDALLIGEVWETATHWLNGKIFDSAMNYDFRKHARRFFAEGSIDAAEFNGRVTNMLMRYAKQTVYAQLNLLDSHDVSRFLSLCEGDRDRYKLAVLFQLTFPGIPSIFYGDELEIEGIQEADYRSPMPWGTEATSVTDFFKRAIALRKEYEVLRRGEYEAIMANEGEYVYAYRRYDASSSICVVMNLGDTDYSLNLEGRNEEILWSSSGNPSIVEAKGFVIFKENTICQ